MTWLSDGALDHLRRVADRPDLTGTRYRIEEEIGRGGMGTVYRAHDLELDRPVALKVLALEGSAAGDGGDGEGLAERLRREARILARLEHPGVVPVHDVLELPDGRVAYAMKWVRGERLDEHVTGETSLVERLWIFRRICEAVDFAHAHGVIHRDLKPANVMVGAFGEVLVMDWGVAKMQRVATNPDPETGAPADTRHDSRREGRHENRLSGRGSGSDPGPSGDAERAEGTGGTAHGTVLGTPGFMAPEQARGDVEAVDERSDVHALGALLAFLLPDPAPAPLIAVADKARATRPEDRYPGVRELAADVSRFLEGLAVSAYPEGLWRKTRRFARRYRAAILLMLAYLVMRILLFLFAPG